MIARIWRGVVQLDDADAYAGYLRDTGFTEYAQRHCCVLWVRGMLNR